MYASFEQRELWTETEEPTTPDAFFKSLCDYKVGDLFKKCKEEEPSSKKKMSGKGKGKGGERRRRASDDNRKAEILTYISALSPENKERLSLAIENRDSAEVNSIFDRLN
jgi:hypothetical protein